MSESQAKVVASALGGEAYHSGGNHWLVMFRRGDGSMVVISEGGVGLYGSEDGFHYGEPVRSIEFLA